MRKRARGSEADGTGGLEEVEEGRIHDASSKRRRLIGADA